jgi:hypothetical protein
MSPIYLIFIVLSYLLVRRNLDVLIDSNFVSVDGVGYSRQLPISFEVTEHELDTAPRIRESGSGIPTASISCYEHAPSGRSANYSATAAGTGCASLTRT